MTRTLSMWTAMVALLVSAAGVFAQGVGNDSPDPVMVAQRCVASMETATDRTTGAIGDTTAAAVALIARLDAAGAPDREIIRVGQAGTERVQVIGRFGASRVTNIAEHCTRALRRLGADRALIGRVQNAAEGFREDIRNAVARGSMAIRQAVADAIG